MNSFDLMMTSTFTGFGVAVGQFMFEQIKKVVRKHREKAQNIGEKIGTGINKRFINKECVDLS